LGRAFRSRIQATTTVAGTNITSYAGGIGAGFVLPVVAKKVDLIAQGLAGNGIGRYGSGVGPDVTVRPDGKLIPIRGYQALVGPEFHPTPNLDIYAYYGEEYYVRTAFKNVFGSPVGYGSQLLNISNCAAPDSTACAAQTRYVYQIQPGFWYRFYRGPKGTLQWGLSYSYVYRKTYQGLNGSALTSTTFTPLGIENIVMTSFRYYIP